MSTMSTPFAEVHTGGWQGIGRIATHPLRLLASARLEAFARWLAHATHERVRLEEGYEHPGDASQPDNLHEH